RGVDSTVLDLEDFIVSNLLLPIGSLIVVLFCVTKWGWGYDKYLEEVHTGEGMKMPRWLKGYVTYVIPCMILIILVMGLK
ncbi:MAG: sodium-dependent transporter, partial [Lachnospiraceae bacterium]|nr:sodium-dependent transporter [Lachnospiraceae bacterium]